MRKSPFWYGREVQKEELVDRVDELRIITRSMLSQQRLFVIGPRRYGKTSLLATAAAQAEQAGAIVLRVNAEAYTEARLLAQELLSLGTNRLQGSVKKALSKVTSLFGKLRPQVSFNPIDNSWSASLAVDSQPSQEQYVVEVLNGLDQLAATLNVPVCIVIDEFQSLVAPGGITAERQLRAVIQTHRHLGYVFAGSEMSMMIAMTSDHARPFYRLGKTMFLGPIPRAAFKEDLVTKFAAADITLEDAAAERILVVTYDVPYNVQRLADELWVTAELEDQQVISELQVDQVLGDIVRAGSPSYEMLWSQLPATQQKALHAIVATFGQQQPATKATAKQFGLSVSTLKRAVEALVKKSIIRPTLGAAEGAGYRFEDPFFVAWMEEVLPEL